jgi:hypothetical protein
MTCSPTTALPHDKMIYPGDSEMIGGSSAVGERKGPRRMRDAEYERSCLSPPNILHEIDRPTAGEYVCFGGRLVGFDDPRPSIAAEFLLNEAIRDEIYARFAARFENFDTRAVLSIWTKWYLNAFLPPVLLADLLLMRGTQLKQFAAKTE